MKLEVGHARMVLDGSGEATVTVVPSGRRKRQVRVDRAMAALSPQEAASKLGLWQNCDTEAIVLTAKAGVPFSLESAWSSVGDDAVVAEILDKAREIVSNRKLHAAVDKAIRKRKEKERRERVSSHAVRVKAAIKQMMASGGTVDEIMATVQETLVASVQEG